MRSCAFALMGHRCALCSRNWAEQAHSYFFMRARLTLIGLTLLLVQACTSMHSDPQAQVARLANTSWVAETIGGVAVSPKIESTLEVDAERHVAGRGGCNPYVSDIGVGPDYH